MAGFEGWLRSLNLPFSKVQARLAKLSEIIGGALMTIGLFTRVGAFLCLCTMIVAALIGHKGGGYLITEDTPLFLNLAKRIGFDLFRKIIEKISSTSSL